MGSREQAKRPKEGGAMDTSREGPRIYNLFPRLFGSVDKWKGQLDRIAEMGFNWVFVNPFHLTGASGSLYAVKDYFQLNPAFRGRSKRAADALIRDFTAAADKRGLKVMMDLVLNHTARDSELAARHPEWYRHGDDGTLASPFAVDPADTRNVTVWEDLAELDYRQRPERAEIVDYFSQVIDHYLGLGIRGFRCDAAYKVPREVWRELIDRARRHNDEVMFAAESLGALLEQVEAMRGAGFDFLFNSSKWWDCRSGWLLEQYQQFRSIAPSIAFPETHDTERLVTDLARLGITEADAVERAYRHAYLFAAAFSSGVMIPAGFEHGLGRKLHVVDTTPDEWESGAFDLAPTIAAINRMKANAPVLNEEGPQRHVALGGGRVAALLRRAEAGPDWALTVINADRHAPSTARIEGLDGDIGGGREITPWATVSGFHAGDEITLAPGEVRVFVNQ